MTVMKKWYDCTKCANLEFVPTDQPAPEKCPKCGASMYLVRMAECLTDEEKAARGPLPVYNPFTDPFSEWYRPPRDPRKAPKVECPYCRSTKTEMITGFNKAADSIIYGMLGKKQKRWHCNRCERDF